VFVQLDLAAVSAVAAAVAQHVQSCFTQEKTLASMVDACTTVEEVNSVVVPALGYAIPAVTL
jgi:hypothetical protein